MHFFLLGASGRTGQHVVTELLARGHTAVALVRTPSNLKARPGLTIATGSPLSESDVRATIFAAPNLTPDATIVTLNTVRESDSPFAAQVSPPRFLADSCANVCKILEQAGLKRIVIMSTAGVGDSWKKLPLLSKAFMGLTNIKFALEDHGIVDKEIRSTKLDWTLVRAVRLDFGESTTGNKGNDVRILGSDGSGMGMMDSVNVRDAALFLIKAVTDGSFLRQAVVIAN